MDVKKQNNDVIKEIIEKHFENMVDDVLAHTETYYEALEAVGSIKEAILLTWGSWLIV